jgi:hypothetical protein
MKYFKLIPKIFLAALLLYILSININLYHQPTFKSYEGQKLNKGVIRQLAHLKKELHGGAASEMQKLYPEGFVFLNALYALSWADVADKLPFGHSIHQEAIQEINWVLKELDSPKGKAPFNQNLNPAYGIYYRGWSNYVLGRKLKSLPPAKRIPADVALFRKNSTEIIQAQAKLKTPYLESYPFQSWPADMLVGMASVANFEKLYPGTFDQGIKSWLTKVKGKTDHLGLLPHFCDSGTGETITPSKGSSQSLTLVFLNEIDPAFAEMQFQIYKKNFWDSRLGLSGIREFPHGKQGSGDIDSGPVIWGIGGAASIVGQRTMALYGEDAIAADLRNSLEAFGFGKSLFGKKNYLFGVLPMADAFIAWSNAVEVKPDQQLKSEGRIRWQVHLFSLVIFGLVGFWRYRRRRKIVK